MCVCVCVGLCANHHLVRYALIIAFLLPDLMHAACDLYTLAVGFERG